MNKNDLRFIQNQIGYNFNNEDLLEQAFVRRSYSSENGGEDNEVLEFIGDKVLDFIIVKLLTEKYGYMLREYDDFDSNKEFDEFACVKNESELTELKKMLVQKKTLANRIDFLDFADLLIMGNSDKKNKIAERDSVKEDLFEAILGAVALDSDWNLNEMQNVIEIMLDPDSYLEKDNHANYIEIIQNWTLKQYSCLPSYNYEEMTKIACSLLLNGYHRITCSDNYQMNEDTFLCNLRLGDINITFKGAGNSKIDAKKTACKDAYNYLLQNNLLFTIHDEIENPNKNDAINQLETLARRGYFSIPVYTFHEQHDSNGNPIWNCKCTITEEAKSFSAKSSSKKNAKKTAAFEMLKHVLK